MDNRSDAQADQVSILNVKRSCASYFNFLPFRVNGVTYKNALPSVRNITDLMCVINSEELIYSLVAKQDVHTCVPQMVLFGAGQRAMMLQLHVFEDITVHSCFIRKKTTRYVLNCP